MTPKTLRLVLAFLAGFTLLSALPRLPEIMAGARRLAATLPPVTLPAPDQLGDALLGTAAGLLTLLLVLIARRRPATAPTRAAAPGRMRRAVARARAAGRASELGQRLREAARAGARVPDIARQFQLSQDAVRAAIGRSVPGPAAPEGKKFRARQSSLPARPRATPVARGRNPYKALP